MKWNKSFSGLHIFTFSNEALIIQCNTSAFVFVFLPTSVAVLTSDYFGWFFFDFLRNAGLMYKLFDNLDV